MRRRRVFLTVTAMSVVLAMAACSTPLTTTRGPAAAPSTPAGPLEPVSSWQARFDADAPTLWEQSLPLSRSADSWDYYTLAYSIDAYASMYEATGDVAYAGSALDLVENVIAQAKPSRSLPRSEYRDDYLGWASDTAEAGGDEVPLYESFAWRYVTRLLRVLADRDAVADPGLRARYDRILAFSEEDVFDKWYTRGPDETVFRSRTHMTSHWAAISLDLSVLTADPARRARYLEVVRAVDDGMPNYPGSLHGQMRANPEEPAAAVWSPVWGEDGAAQDVAHGNGDVTYIVESCDLRHGSWTDDDVARLGRTLTAYVLGRDGRYPEYVDGSGKGTGWIADGFVRLGRYSPAIQAALEDHGVQNAQYYAAMAVNSAMLAGGGGRC